MRVAHVAPTKNVVGHVQVYRPTGASSIPDSSAVPAWMDEGFLLAQGVAPWTELPLGLSDEPGTAGIWAVSGAGAKAAGRTRPFGETVSDTGRGNRAVSGMMLSCAKV